MNTDASSHQLVGALEQSFSVQEAAAQLGFDWPTPNQVLGKVYEEADEIAEALNAADQKEIEAELSDLLFVTLNLVRHIHKESKAKISVAAFHEQLLQQAIKKFDSRFAHVQEGMQQAKSPLSFEQMETLWQKAKKSE